MKAKIKNVSKGRIHVFLGRIRTINPGEEIETPVQNMFIRPIVGLIAVGAAQVTVTCKRSESTLFERYLRGAPAHIRSKLRFIFEDEAKAPAESKTEESDSKEENNVGSANDAEQSSEEPKDESPDQKDEDVPDELKEFAEEDLKKKTKKELVEIAEKLGITIHNKTKAELIKEILEHAG